MSNPVGRLETILASPSGKTKPVSFWRAVTSFSLSFRELRMRLQEAVGQMRCSYCTKPGGREPESAHSADSGQSPQPGNPHELVMIENDSQISFKFLVMQMTRRPFVRNPGSHHRRLRYADEPALTAARHETWARCRRRDSPATRRQPARDPFPNVLPSRTQPWQKRHSVGRFDHGTRSHSAHRIFKSGKRSRIGVSLGIRSGNAPVSAIRR